LEVGFRAVGVQAKQDREQGVEPEQTERNWWEEPEEEGASEAAAAAAEWRSFLHAAWPWPCRAVPCHAVRLPWPEPLE
jgi:hypothetical protein